MENMVEEHDLKLVMTEANGRLTKTKPYVLKTIKDAIAEAISDKPVFCLGVPVKAKHFSQVDFLLPALLFNAGQNLLLPTHLKKKKIDFAFELTAANSSVLMFEVSNISISSPRALKLAIIAELGRREKNGEIFIDDHVEDFGTFIDDQFPEEFDLREMQGKVFLVRI